MTAWEEKKKMVGKIGVDGPKTPTHNDAGSKQASIEKQKVKKRFKKITPQRKSKSSS